MANNLTQSPYIIDTAATIFATGVRVRPKSVRWVGATTAGHQCILENGAGRTVWASVASGANFVDVDRPEDEWNGLIVDTIQSGILYIEL